jgi:hypothetical protein
VLRVVVYVLAGSWALYLVAMNVFLRTRLFRNLISEDPTAILVDYTSAYSIVPGVVHAEGLRIRGSDSNVQWILTIDRCDLHLGVLDFAHKRFHASHVRGDGVSMRVRQKASSFTAEEAAALPPVPGFTDPPMAAPKGPPLTDAQYDLWSIWLEDVVADHVREVWVDTMRYTGDLQIRGRWFFRPVRWLDVGPAAMEIRTLDVSYGPLETWASGVTGRLLVTIHPFDVRAVPLKEMPGRVSVDGDLRGAVHVATIAQRALRGTPVEAVRGESSFAARIALDHGVVLPGTHVHVDPFGAVVAGLGLDVAAEVEAGVVVDDDRLGHATVEVRGARATQAGTARASLASVKAAVASRDLDLTRPFTDPSYEVAIDDLAAPSLAYWSARLPLPAHLGIDSGELHASGQGTGSLTKETLDGDLRAAVHGLAVDGGQERVRGDLATTVRVVASLAERRADLSSSEVSLEGVHAEARGVTVTATHVALHAPRLVVVAAGVLGQVVLDAPSVDVPSLAPLGTLFSLPSGIALQDGRAHGQAHLAADLGGGAVEGSALIVGHDVRARVGSMAMRGDLELRLRARQRGGLTDVSGSSLQFRPPAKDGWWARVDVPQATVSLRGGPRINARVLVRAQDASPLTALLESHADVAAKLALGVVSTSDLRASGDIVAGPAAFEARSFVIRADGLGIDFEMAELGPERIGAAYLVVGPVHAGVDLQNDSTRVMLFGAEPWFAAKRTALRARERAYE